MGNGMEKTCYFPQIWKQTIPGDYSHSYKCSFDYISSLKKHRDKTLLQTQLYINIDMTIDL